MAFTFHLPRTLRAAGWKVKIRDKETREPPHVTIIRGTKAWRINLRTGEFMDAKPDPGEVPREVVLLILEERAWRQLCGAWNAMYPTNPVSHDDDEE